MALKLVVPDVSQTRMITDCRVDERLQILDLVQDLLVSSGSRCPHMQTESSSFDTGMVSYLASSRFGPAILTTYAQKVSLPALLFRRSFFTLCTC